MTEEKTEYPDPTQVQAARIKSASGTLELLLAYADIPELFDSEKFKESVDDLKLFLKEELDRNYTDPKAFPSNEWYRENVASLSDGELEADSNAIVSRGEDSPGAYVQTWSWVDAPVCDDCDKPMQHFDSKQCDECKAEQEEDE
jgi:hypothetical protein